MRRDHSVAALFQLSLASLVLSQAEFRSSIGYDRTAQRGLNMVPFLVQKTIVGSSNRLLGCFALDLSDPFGTRTLQLPPQI